MKKQTVIITGGNSGLGYQVAQNIAMDHQYTVIIACRNQAKAQAAVTTLKNDTANSEIFAMTLDLSSFASIRAFNQAFSAANFPPLFGLVCNAGLNPTTLQYTKDGVETTFGVNYLGHYLLTNLLLDKIVDNGRIAFVSSDTHQPPRILPIDEPAFKDIEPLAHPSQNDLSQRHAAMNRYPMSKLCNILCAYELSAKLQQETDKHILVNAFNPGLMANTNFNGVNNRIANAIMSVFMNAFGAALGRLGNAKSSGKALAEMITSPKYDGQTAKYIDRGTAKQSSDASYDKQAATKLWHQSAQLVGLTSDETIVSF